MSDEVQTTEEVVNAFYPDVEAEPLEVPTAEIEKDETPIEEDDSDIEDEAEEEGSEDDNLDDASDNLVYEINGKDYTAKDIERLESNDKSRQADYTRKTQALSDDVKNLDAAIANTKDLADRLEVLVAEDKEINWAELKEYEPEEYIRLDEIAKKREKALADVKANNQTSNSGVDIEAERAKLIESNPQWLKDGQPTQLYKDDMEGLNAFYTKGEWTQEQVDLVNSNAKLAQLVLDNIRTKDSKVSAKKKIIATPKSGKVKANINKLSPEEIFYGK